MSLRLPGACRRHRHLLAALVEHGERPPGIEAALEHLAVCASCEEELTGLALTVAALRRVGASYRRLPGPTPTARAAGAVLATAAHRPFAVRAPAPRARWAWRLQLSSLAATAAIAALVVLPGATLPPSVPADASAPAHASSPVHAPGVTQWQAAEQRLASSHDTGPVAVVVAAGTLPPRYPDNMLRPWKEVPPSDATARGFEPR